MIDHAEFKRLSDLRAAIQDDINTVHATIRKYEATAARLLKTSQQVARDLLAVERGESVQNALTDHDIVTQNLKAISTTASNMKQGGGAISYSTTPEEQFAAIEKLAEEALATRGIYKK